MTSYLLRRLVASLILLLVVLTTTFFVIHLAPGDPTILLQDPRLSRQHQEELYGCERTLRRRHTQQPEAECPQCAQRPNLRNGDGSIYQNGLAAWRNNRTVPILTDRLF